MKLVIVTGMSGAGKTIALKMLEDLGFYCVDNLPISLVDKFSQLAAVGGEIKQAALGIDIRSGEELNQLEAILKGWKDTGLDYQVLFLDANDGTLIKRYKETRRSHPLAGAGRLDKGIEKERLKLAFLKKDADFIIDTSQLLTRELRQELEKIFLKDQDFNNMFITILSFGFKYGIPEDADLVFDVRFLPNPFYVESMRHKSGAVPEVAAYIDQWPVTKEFKQHLDNLVNFLIPQYEKEGKAQLVIAAGCTGGMHRSVFIANHIYQLLKEKGCVVKLEHRDLMKNEVWEHVREEV